MAAALGGYLLAFAIGRLPTGRQHINFACLSLPTERAPGWIGRANR